MCFLHALEMLIIIIINEAGENSPQPNLDKNSIQPNGLDYNISIRILCINFPFSKLFDLSTYNILPQLIGGRGGIETPA